MDKAMYIIAKMSMPFVLGIYMTIIIKMIADKKGKYINWLKWSSLSKCLAIAMSVSLGIIFVLAIMIDGNALNSSGFFGELVRMTKEDGHGVATSYWEYHNFFTRILYTAFNCGGFALGVLYAEK